MKNWLLAVLAIITISCEAQIKSGQAAPEIALPDAKGVITRLSAFKGKVVLLDFWASWCNPCRRSNPGVVALYNKYKSKGFEVFGVSIDSKKSAWLKAVQQDGITYTQVNDRSGWYSKTAATYGVEQIPTTFLIDKTGMIVAVDMEGAELEKKINELLQ